MKPKHWYWLNDIMGCLLFRRSSSQPEVSSTAAILDAEALEDRTLLSTAYPTAYEQYMLELVNLARANPTAYAASLGIDLNEGLAPNTISSAAKQPLAISPYLTDSAALHSQWMLDTDTFSHTGSGGSSPFQRMSGAGYVFNGSWSCGENIAYMGTTGTVNVSSFTKSMEESLFVDAGISGRGHRRNLMSDSFVEVGVGIRTGPYSGFNTVMASQDFAKSGTSMYLTGVAFADTVTVDNFYTPGEGLANISIVAIRDGNGARYETTTWSSGGYRLELPKGRYSIMAKGAALGASQFIPSINMGTKNMKRDFKVGMIRVAPEIAVIGNGRYIPNNDSTPRSVDNTDYGSVAVAGGTLVKTFSIANLGNGTLNLTGSPRVTIAGPNAADFVVTSQPAGSSMAGESTLTFSVQFDPSASGLRTAVISIASDDANECPFTFTIVGNGTDAAMYAVGPTLDGTTNPLPGASQFNPTSNSWSDGNVSASRTYFDVVEQNHSIVEGANEMNFSEYYSLASIQRYEPQALGGFTQDTMYSL